LRDQSDDFGSTNINSSDEVLAIFFCHNTLKGAVVTGSQCSVYADTKYFAIRKTLKKQEKKAQSTTAIHQKRKNNNIFQPPK